MKGRKGFTLIELLVVIAIIAVLAAILFPVFAKARKAAQAADCESNMMQIGRAIKLYLVDWKDTYPLNRDLAGATQIQVQLDNPAPGAAPILFHYGVNWVEALQPFMEAITRDSAGAWRCGAATSKFHPTIGALALTAKDFGVNYAFNYNMIGQPEGVIKAASQLMLVREFDRRLNSSLRPMNVSPDANTPPLNPFLSGPEVGGIAPPINPQQHGLGSNMLFADGHVKHFEVGYFPGSPLNANNYDVGDGQWYNFCLAGTPVAKMKSIAITP